MSNPSSGELAVTRNARYYASDELMIFQVENTLFKVHRSVLEKYCPVFKDMFAFKFVPTSESGSLDGPVGEGKSDGQPIILPEVTVFEFETLLDEIYLVRRTARGDWAVPIIGSTDWSDHPLGNESGGKRALAFLSIAHRYGLVVNHRLVMKAIVADASINDVDAIEAGRTFDVPIEHLREPLVKLVKRDKPLSSHEMHCLDFDISAKAAEAREVFKTSPKHDRDEGQASRIVTTVIGLPPIFSSVSRICYWD
ncbi:hypothetical protein EVG20_g4569 [Dentipellis fragilis]|uniref:BTB domain-containing protein n=1 Tax=Dentipellis fragilis TaxID=205917 RepID=A0A4Y9YY28_9AGAM|nr:hypothetical protein EVG20_g4569 [Dentipellis fragilis]